MRSGSCHELILAGLAFVLLAGCAQAQKVERDAAVEEAAFQSAIKRVRLQPADYKICGADLLEVRLFEQEEIDRVVRVSQKGVISLPLIGIVEVGGLSVTEAEAAIAARYQDFFVEPQVTVFIREYSSKRVFVMGEVRRPGSFPLPVESRLTVVEVVSLAEGFTPVADQDRTRVIRFSQGESRSFTIVVSDITKRGHKDLDLALEPGDVVWVPQSFF